MAWSHLLTMEQGEWRKLALEIYSKADIKEGEEGGGPGNWEGQGEVLYSLQTLLANNFHM